MTLYGHSIFATLRQIIYTCTGRHNGPEQRAHCVPRITQRRRAAAGSSPPPLTLTTGTKSPTQRTSEHCVPGCQSAVKAAAHSSILCAKNRPSEPRLSRLKRQRSPIAQVIDLRREIQTVNARMPNGRSAQTARQGRVGARAGSPGAIGRPGRRRQTSAHRNQTGAIMRRVVEGASAAKSAAPSNEIAKHSTGLYALYDALRPRASIS